MHHLREHRQYSALQVSSAFSDLTLPPYWMRTASAVSLSYKDQDVIADFFAYLFSLISSCCSARTDSPNWFVRND